MPPRRLLLACLAATLAAGPAAAARKKTHAAPAPARRKRAAPARAAAYAASDEMRAFADEVAGRRALDAAWIVRQLSQAQKLPSVQQLMMPPPAGSPKNWAAYRERFVEPRRIAAGSVFWQQNDPWLRQAEERFGVPAEIVVGVIGVETFYGRMTGGFRVIDALSTLSFDFPTGRKDRTPFFRSELEEFLVWCERERLECTQVKGSFAGAIGLPQFMPGSINRFAVDFDGDGHVDLLGSAADAIGSVAHYLQQHGWQRGQPTHYEVTPPAAPEELALLLAPDILPSFTAAQMAGHGARLDDAARDHAGRLALVELENGAQPKSYVAGTQNFYAVTRYNWSSYYAMAVIALGEAVRRMR